MKSNEDIDEQDRQYFASVPKVKEEPATYENKEAYMKQIGCKLEKFLSELDWKLLKESAEK